MEKKHTEPQKFSELRPDNGEMFRVPSQILGDYAQLDAFATYQFYRKILNPVMNRFTHDFAEDYIYPSYRTLLRATIDNYQVGIKINRKGLLKSQIAAQKKVRNLITKMFKVYAEEIKHIEETSIEKYLGKKTNVKEITYLKKEEKKEPVKYNKAGKLLKSWLIWASRKRLAEKDLAVRDKRLGYVPVESSISYKATAHFRLLKNFMKRYRTDPDILNTCPKSIRPFLFNPNSPEHKKKILYPEHLKDSLYEISKPHMGEERENRGTIYLKDKKVEIEMTKSGGMPTGGAVLAALRPRSALIEKYNKAVKELQFINSTYNKMTDRDKIHLPIKFPGTYTLRLGGDGGLNCQNIIKDPGYLRNWIPSDPEYAILQLDFSALEPTVLAQLSGDDALMTLYGPNAKPNDVYIFTGYLMGGMFRETFEKYGYDPYNPTKEAISKIKKNEKNLRNVCKLICLSGDYGAGPGKQHRTLRILSFDYAFEEVKEMNLAFKKAYKGKFDYAQRITKEWERNSGWFLDGLGLPICVDQEKKKDLLNRICQRSGHLILQIWLHLVLEEFEKQEIDYEWMIVDFHDETIPTIRRDQIATVKNIYKTCLDKINNELLLGTIILKAEPQEAESLAEIKVENFKSLDDIDFQLDNEELMSYLEEALTN